jgi:pimeloyl-ACP methyl ester carboxylesterase
MQILYITGRNGHSHRGLGKYLNSLTGSFSGISLDPVFLRQPFDVQVANIQTTIDSPVDHKIVANSYGGYLLMHALIDRPEVGHDILLLSPVLGKAISLESMSFSRPPGANRLLAALEHGRIAKPRHMEIHTGEVDHSCCPLLAAKFAEGIPADRFELIPGQGHMIDRPIVQSIIDDFITRR